MNASSNTETATIGAHSRALYVVAVACLPLIVAGLLTQIVFISGFVQRDDGVSHKTRYAYFNYPVTGDLVENQFDVSGRIESIPKGAVVYLVERVDNQIWPKQRIGSEPTSFQRTQHTTSGKGYKYTIELLSVSANAEELIISWFDRGKKTGQYPGIELIEDSTVLAKVRVVHR